MPVIFDHLVFALLISCAHGFPIKSKKTGKFIADSTLFMNNIIICPVFNNDGIYMIHCVCRHGYDQKYGGTRLRLWMRSVSTRPM